MPDNSAPFLIWSQGIRQYLKGERIPINDLMAWNADATRMSYRMHSEYLRRLFVEKEPADGQYVDPDTWMEKTKVQAGSWWPAWVAWLTERSTGKIPPPETGAPEAGFPPLADAPGRYVLDP